MAPVAVQTNGANKLKKSAPPDIQTNGATSLSASPLPSATKPKPPSSAKLPPNTVSERPIASSVRPSNRIRRDTANHLGRNSRNSAGLRSGPLNEDPNAANTNARPHVLTPSFILRKFAGRPPSLVVHLHPQHFRFDGQDGMFSYRSPMSMFLEHLKTRTLPHDILDYLISSGVSFYDGCLIVQVHDHKSVAQAKDAAKPATKSKAPKISSIHKHNPYVTPSSYAPFAKDELGAQNGDQKLEEDGKPTKLEEQEDKGNGDQSTEKQTPSKPKVFTVVLMPTPESLSRDLLISATTPALQLDGRPAETPGGAPQTPSALVPPTPTASSMPPPAKRQKKEKMEIDPGQLRAAEGQILTAMEAPLILGPKAANVESQILMLEAMAHPKHSESPPAPKTRKRTVAEMAADEAAASEQERYMLFLDERPGAAGAQTASGADADAQTGAAAFEPTFERFKVIAQIKQEHAEKKEQEKIKQQENDRKLQLQRQTQQTQAEAQAQKQQNDAEKARREAAAVRERQAQQAEAQRQMAARAATQNSGQQNNQPNGAQGQHGHPQQNAGMQNGMPNNAGGQQHAGQSNMGGQAQARFQAQVAQAQAQGSSPVVRQGTPQNHSSPMVNNAVPMQQTSSAMAGSPPRPSSVVQNPPMSVPMAHNMSARGSQQSHPSNTPRMPHGTPNMAHGTPINRQNLAATPRMTQTSPPPNMMAQNSQMGPNMMMNNPNMAQNPQLMAQMAAQQRVMAAQQQHQQQQQHQHQQGMQGMQGMPGMNGQMQGQIHNQQQMLQMMRNQQQQQMMMQQQQQQQQQQQGHPQQQPNGMLSAQHLAQQYAHQVQNMQGGNMRQMSPQMAQMQQQMARMNQMGGNGMQRQVSNQMMNGQNPHMNPFTMQQMQQLQQQQAAQQHQQQQQPQQHQQRQPQQLNPQVQHLAKQVFNQLLNDAAGKFGGPDNIPAEVRETFKNQALHRANGLWHAQVRQRQQVMMQQQQQQQQQQQAAAMQNMGGMMGHQGM